MKIEQFQRLAEAHGADLACWPAKDIVDAVRLLRAEPAAARILADAETLDRLLDRARPEIGEDDAERVWAAIARRAAATRPVPMTAWMRLRPILPTAAFLATMWVVGLIGGTWSGASTIAATDLARTVADGFYQPSYLSAWNE
jgi:anti-sigma factor RsiW